MIRVEVKKENKKIKEIILSGHALYDDYGKDIVCASVSSIVITTINAILSIDDKSINYEEKNGLTIKVIKDDIVTNKLINNMINMLLELEKDYPKNIKFL